MYRPPLESKYPFIEYSMIPSAVLPGEFISKDTDPEKSYTKWITPYSIPIRDSTVYRNESNMVPYDPYPDDDDDTSKGYIYGTYPDYFGIEYNFPKYGDSLMDKYPQELWAYRPEEEKEFMETRGFELPGEISNSDLNGNGLKNYLRVSGVSQKLINHMKDEKLLYSVYSISPDIFMDTVRNIESNGMQRLGVTDVNRIYNSFLDYYKIYISPEIPDSPSDFSKFNDVQLESKYGPITGLANNKKDLDHMYAKKAKDHVEILTREQASMCSPETSQTLLSLEKFGDVDKFIGIGNILTGYRCYAVEDILSSFESSILNGRLDDPYIPGKEIPIGLVEEMYGLLDNREDRESLKSFIQVRKDFDSTYKEIFSDLRNYLLDPQARKAFKDFMESYFRLGMYMRQWCGPGTEYPLLASQTGKELQTGTVDEIILSERITRENYELQKSVEDLKSAGIYTLVMNLPSVYLHGGIAQFDKSSLGDKYREIIQSPDVESTASCIRMGSSKFVISSAYYLKIFLGYEIPGFSLGQKIQYIS